MSGAAAIGSGAVIDHPSAMPAIPGRPDRRERRAQARGREPSASPGRGRCGRRSGRCTAAASCQPPAASTHSRRTTRRSLDCTGSAEAAHQARSSVQDGAAGSSGGTSGTKAGSGGGSASKPRGCWSGTGGTTGTTEFQPFPERGSLRGVRRGKIRECYIFNGSTGSSGSTLSQTLVGAGFRPLQGWNHCPGRGGSTGSTLGLLPQPCQGRPQRHGAQVSPPARNLLVMQYSRVLPTPGTRSERDWWLPVPAVIQPFAIMALAMAEASKPAQISPRHASGST